MVRWQESYTVPVECLDCGLRDDECEVTEDGEVRSGTFEGGECPNCGGYNLEVE